MGIPEPAAAHLGAYPKPTLLEEPGVVKVLVEALDVVVSSFLICCSLSQIRRLADGVEWSPPARLPHFQGAK